MPFDIGINFRATAGYVTDGANETYSLGEIYPITRGGVTFGWDVDLTANSRDRNSAMDRRLAGINFSNTVGRTFRIDLPSAELCQVHVAAGDATAAENGGLWDLIDNTTVFQSLTGDSLGIANFRDASDVTRSHTDWPSLEISKERLFGSQIFKLAVRAAAASNNVIAHLRIVGLGSSGRSRRLMIGGNLGAGDGMMSGGTL